jgi:hypothetical protein
MNKKTCIISLLAVLLTAAVGCGLAQQPQIPMQFPMGNNAPWVVVRPDGNVAPRKIDTILDTTKGTEIVEYAVQRDGPEIIAHPVPLSGFSKIRFRVWSREKTMLMIVLEDGDKAKFHTPVFVSADSWTNVSVFPNDFQINDDSPVKKQALDPQLVSSPFILIDAGFFMGQKGPNTLKICDFTVDHGKGEPIISLDVPSVIDGRTVTIAQSGAITHPVFVRNGGKLVITAPSVRIGANIRVEDSALEVHGCSLVMDNKFSHQLTLGFKHSTFLLDECEFASPFMSNLYLNSSHLTYKHCRFHANGFTCAPEKSTIDLDDVAAPGEFIVQEGCEFKLNGCRGTLLWLAFGPGQKANLALPAPTATISKFALPSETKLNVSIDESELIMWALVTKPGSDVRIHDSDVRAAGMAFAAGKPIKLANIKDNLSGKTANFDLADRKLSFVNCNVQAFCFYPMTNSRLEVCDSIFGELNAFKNAEVVISNSTCDGSGGYILASDNCTVRLVNCILNCPVVAVNDGQLTLEHCQVNGDTSAADNSIIKLIGTTLKGTRQQIGNGRIVEHS